MKRFFKNKTVTITLSILMMSGVVLSIFPLNLPGFQDLPDYAVRLILIYLFLGMFFLFLSNTRLLMISFLAAGILSFFLKTLSNENFNLSERENYKSINISNFNLINLESDYLGFLEEIMESDAELVCFHEVNPGWNRIIKGVLLDSFPHYAEVIRIDAFGKMILSRTPFLDVDTFYFEGLPNLDVQVDFYGTKSHLISTQLVPPFQTFKGLASRENVDYLASYINKITSPLILVGEFNQVYWSKELRALVEKTRLENSRRFISSVGSKVPYEHIFHSSEFECSNVHELSDAANAHIGMEASFHFKSWEGFSRSFLNAKKKED